MGWESWGGCGLQSPLITDINGANRRRGSGLGLGWKQRVSLGRKTRLGGGGRFLLGRAERLRYLHGRYEQTSCAVVNG